MNEKERKELLMVYGDEDDEKTYKLFKRRGLKLNDYVFNTVSMGGRAMGRTTRYILEKIKYIIESTGVGDTVKIECVDHAGYREANKNMVKSMCRIIDEYFPELKYKVYSSNFNIDITKTREMK